LNFFYSIYIVVNGKVKPLIVAVQILKINFFLNIKIVDPNLQIYLTTVSGLFLNL